MVAKKVRLASKKDTMRLKKSSGKTHAAGKSKHRRRRSASSESDDEDVINMRRQLTSIGCQLHEVEADGNCLFRALGDQLFGDQEQHFAIRKRICEYVNAHRTDFEPFMEDEEDFDHYIKRMMEQGTWGGNLELFGAACYFRVYVVVHQQGSHVVIECEKVPRKVINVAYTGSEHYDSVRAMGDDAFDRPPKEISLDIDGLRPQDLAKRWKGKEQQPTDRAKSHTVTENSSHVRETRATTLPREDPSSLSSSMNALHLRTGPADANRRPMSHKARRKLKQSHRK